MEGFLSPLRLSWVRLAVLPSMAMTSCRPGHMAATKDSKQRANSDGSIRFIKSRSQRAHGTP